MFGGDGNDTLVWNPGDGNDLVEGQAGANDTMEFNGAAGAEIFEASAAVGGRLRFTRNLGEHRHGRRRQRSGSTSRTLGGADATTVNDLTAPT